jgi:hypothetical protein
MKKLTTLLALIGFCVFATSAMADIIYSQNFNALTSGGALPAGWTSLGGTGSNTTYSGSIPIPLNPGIASTSTTMAASWFQTDTATFVMPTGGPKINGQSYPTGFGAAPNDLMLGSAPTSTAFTAHELALTNNTALPYTNVTLDYDLYVLSYAFTSAAQIIESELPGYGAVQLSTDGGTTWSALPANNNGTPSTTAYHASTPLLASWAPGQTLKIRWFDDNVQTGSPDQDLGLDNVVISGSQVPEPSTLVMTLVGLAGVALVWCRRK